MTRPWTEEELNFLKENYFKLSAQEIADKLNRSLNSIYIKAKKIGLDNKRKKEIDWDLVYQLYVIEKRTLKEIGEMLNIHWQTISNKMPKQWKEALKINIEYDDLYELYVNQEKSIKEIGRIYGVSETMIRNRLNTFNIKIRGLDKEKIKKLNDEDIKKYYIDDGLSCNEIAQIFNVSIKTIIKRLKKNGVELRPQSEYIAGAKNPFWKGGIHPEKLRLRKSSKYKEWREKVFQRDNYTCQKCGDNKGGNLHAHHILNFSEHDDLRFNVNNGITLCEKCHDFKYEGSFHHIYGTKNNTKEQLEEFLGRKLDFEVPTKDNNNDIKDIAS